MALMITEDCSLCDDCIDRCPNRAITTGEPNRIDPMKCTECVGADDAPQCVAICPSDCIVPNPDWQESKEELQMKYNRLHEKH